MKNLRTDQIRELMARYAPMFQAMGLDKHPVTKRRLDSDDTAFLTRQIEVVRSTVLEVRHADLLSRRFIPTATDLPSWATFAVQIVYDDAGQARVVANGADDIPAVDVKVSEQTFSIASIAAKYGFSVMDLRQALGTGVPLQDRKARTCRRVVDTAIDELLATGKLASANQNALGMAGFLNHSEVPTIALLTDGFYKPATTGDQMLSDLNVLARAPRIASNQIFPATNMILSQGVFDVVSTKPRGTGTDKSVLEVFQAQHPEITVDVWHRCDIQVDSTHDKLVAYHKSPEVVEAIVTQEFEQLPPQYINMRTEINCHARCGGVRLHQAKGMAYASASTATS
jgi:hypothetical protein